MPTKEDVASITTTPVVTNNDSKMSPSTVEAGDSNLYKVLFFLMGFADLFFWNCILNILYDIRDKVYPDYPSMTDTLNAANNISNLIVTIYTVKTGAMNTTVTTMAAVVLSVSCLLTAITVQWIPGLGGVIVLHFTNFLAGGCAGFFQTGVLGLASVLGTGILSSFFSGGQGGCGVATFTIWTILSHAKLTTKNALWVLMSIGLIVQFVSAIFFAQLCRRPGISDRIKVVQQTLIDEATNPDAPSYKFLLKSMWLPCALGFWCMYITLLFYPNIGPMSWSEGDFTNYTLGAYQIGDLIGRYMPALNSIFLISMKLSSYLVVGRTVLIASAILSWRYPENVFWGSKVWHIVSLALLSISNGWLISSIYVHGPSYLPQENWRSRAMSLILLSILVGIGGGLWSARIFTAIVN